MTLAQVIVLGTLGGLIVELVRNKRAPGVLFASVAFLFMLLDYISMKDALKQFTEAIGAQLQGAGRGEPIVVPTTEIIRRAKSAARGEAARYTLNWLSASGTAILFAALITALSSGGIAASAARTGSLNQDWMPKWKNTAAKAATRIANAVRLTAPRFMPGSMVQRNLGRLQVSNSQGGDSVRESQPGMVMKSAVKGAQVLDWAGPDSQEADVIRRCIAGDDTVLCVASEQLGGRKLADQLRQLAGIDKKKVTSRG